MVNLNKICFSIFVLCLSVVWGTPSIAAKLETNFQNGKLDVEAESVPMVEILEKIAAWTGVKIMSGAELDGLISCSFINEETETVLKKLLRNHNSVFLYRKDQDDIVIDTVRIMGSKALTALNKNNHEPENELDHFEGPESNLTQKRYKKNWFTSELKDSKRLPKQIQAEADQGNLSQDAPDENEPRENTGIKITMVAAGSIFDKIGLQENDRVTDINGSAVTSTSTFINLIKSSVDMGVVRIERYDDEGGIDHIYIELN